MPPQDRPLIRPIVIPPTRTLRTVSNFVTVTDQTMRAPKPEDWLIHRGNYQAWGYSPLDQINGSRSTPMTVVC